VFENPEVIHADQRGLGAAPGRENDALAAVGCVVDQRREVIPGIGQTHDLHDP